MTGRETLGNGANRLYEEDVTPRDSLAFDILTLLGGKAIGWIGMTIDRGLDALGLGKVIERYINTGKKQEQNGYQTVPQPAMASGYTMTMAKQPVPQAIPVIYRGQRMGPIKRRYGI